MTASLTLDAVLAPAPNLLESDMGREKVFLDVDQGRYFGVNGTGREIFDRCDGRQPLSAICEQILQEYDVDPETLCGEVLEFASRLMGRGLLVVHADPASSPSGSS